MSPGTLFYPIEAMAHMATPSHTALESSILQPLSQSSVFDYVPPPLAAKRRYRRMRKLALGVVDELIRQEH